MNQPSVTERVHESLVRVVKNVPRHYLAVDTSAQKLFHIVDSQIIMEYHISTSKYGIGNRENSLMTPLGVHYIKEKYGHNVPLGRIFRDRIDTCEDWPIGTPGENLILTRILRLAGMEDGVNRGEGIDTYERYIYIHGTNNETAIGTPSSHGCICMKNTDVVDLFEKVSEGTFVVIY